MAESAAILIETAPAGLFPIRGEIFSAEHLEEYAARLAEAHVSARPGRRGVPLTGGEKAVDVVVVCSAPEAVQHVRVLDREGMTEDKLRAILAKQTPDAEKRRRADFIVETGEGYEAAHDQVRQIIATLRARQQAR